MNIGTVSCQQTTAKWFGAVRHAFRASSASSKSLPLSPRRPRKSATDNGKSLGKRVPKLCQLCVNKCVFVCILCNGGALRRTTQNSTFVPSSYLVTVLCTESNHFFVKLSTNTKSRNVTLSTLQVPFWDPLFRDIQV